MDNIKKTPLEEAKISFQQIKDFATEAVKKEFENELNIKVEKILNESLKSVEVDDENNITVTTDEKVIALNNDGEVENVENVDGIEGAEITDGNLGGEDDEEIEIEKNIEEMMYNEEEQLQQAPAADGIPAQDAAAPADASAPADAPTEEVPAQDAEVPQEVTNLAKAFFDAIKSVTGGEEQGDDQGVDYIDDEAADTAAPAPAPAPAAPVQEDALFEFNMEEMENENKEKIEFEDVPKDDELFEFTLEEETEELDEMQGVGHNFKHDNKLGILPNEGANYRKEYDLKESTNKIKAQYESKIDELLKENKRLNESNKEFGEVIKNYRSSFTDLRKQFDEMQTFNAKLAYANKIFASGGLSTAEKAMIAENFDKTQTREEAKKLYDKILEENKIFINKDNVSKIKSPATNTIKAKETIYESAEMKRRKVLAGIDKNEDC